MSTEARAEARDKIERLEFELEDAGDIIAQAMVERREINKLLARAANVISYSGIIAIGEEPDVVQLVKDLREAIK